MSYSKETSERAPTVVILDDKFIFDKTLNTFPRGWECDSPDDIINELCPVPQAAMFPSPGTFAQLAHVAYFDHWDDGTVKCTLTDEIQLDGFTFLTATANNNWDPVGYYGVAYVNRDRRQVVLSHRGTKLPVFGFLVPELSEIALKQFTHQLSPALTFAFKVVRYAAKRGYQVFFTGHSLGAWLAQITTFSMIYLTLAEAEDHFVAKQQPLSNIRMPYTVVFDSPGAYEFLLSLKKSLFRSKPESTQTIDVKELPVEVFLFHPNPFLCVNLHIGRIFILDEKAGLDTNKYFGNDSHGVGPVVDLLSEWGEVKDPFCWGVASKYPKELAVRWDQRSVPMYFFSTEERKFLTKGEGSDWMLIVCGHFVKVCGEWDALEFIPRVRHIVKYLPNITEDNPIPEHNGPVPFSFIEQIEFLKQQFGLNFDAEESLRSLPSSTRKLMGYPLMLSLYAQAVSIHGMAPGGVNLFDLYSQFMNKLHAVEDTPGDCVLNDNLQFYFACAVEELIGSLRINTSGRLWTKSWDLRETFLELPTGRKLEELISNEMLLEKTRFKYRGYAEYFYAKLLTDERRTSQELRNILFARIYERDVAENVEVFVRAALLERHIKQNSRTKPFQESLPLSLGLLRGEEAGLFLGELRVQRLVKGWLDLVSHKDAALETLAYNMRLSHKGKVDGFERVDLMWDRLHRIPGELAGATNKGLALMRFFKGQLFLFLCGWSVFVSLGYKDHQILRSIKTAAIESLEKPGLSPAPHLCDYTTYRDGKRSALIVNVLTERPGAEIDQVALQETLRRCGFEVDVAGDCSRLGIREAVRQFRAKVNRIVGLAAVLVAVGSHGDGYDFFLSSDGGRLHLMGDIVDQFNGGNCRELQEIPKIFLFNICRGNKVDGGWSSVEDWWKAEGPKKLKDSTGNRWPTWSNMIVAFASYEGYVAYRDIESGSWFFQEFCRIVKTHARGMCIKTILEKVSDEVIRKTTEDGGKQTPTWKNVGFTRSLLFNYE